MGYGRVRRRMQGVYQSEQYTAKHCASGVIFLTVGVPLRRKWLRVVGRIVLIGVMAQAFLSLARAEARDPGRLQEL